MWVRGENPERGDRIAEGAIPWRIPEVALNLADTPLLSAVDPYGDTVFNRLQVRRQLPTELQYLRRELPETEGPMLDELERLMEVTSERVHRYLWFVGD